MQEGFEQLKEAASGANPTTISQFIKNSATGTSFFDSVCSDYSDHVAVTAKGKDGKKVPLSLEEFFEQTTYYRGLGDYYTYEKIN